MWQTINVAAGVAGIGTNLLPAVYPATGNVFWVGNLSTVPSNSVAGVDDPSYGISPQRPFKTINYAITKCTANNGDIIYVLPGHTETIKAAGGITCGVAGVTIIGLGTGSSRPSITLSTATTATFLVTAANVTVKNIYFDATGIDAIATTFDVQAAGFTLDSCEHYFAKTSYVSILGMSVNSAASAKNLTINNCFIHGDAAANCTNWLQLVGGANIKVTNNVISGSFTTSLGCVNNITAAVTDILVANNILRNNTGSATKVVVLLTGSTGAIVNNRCGIGSGAVPFTADACHWAGNWSAAAVATNGTLV